MSFKYLLFFIVFCLIGCQDRHDPLHKTIEEIESSWTEEQLKEFSEKPDSVALAEIHFGYGMDFRNKKFRNEKDTTLVNYFHSLDIYHEDYMSSIIFASLHRKLNNKPIDLDEQLKLIHSIVTEVKTKEDKNTKRAIRYYKKYFKGDTILVRMPLRNKEYATRYSYPEDSEWVYNDSIDLLIRGVIKEKPKLKDTMDMYFKLQILSMNHDNIKFVSDNIGIGDIIDSDFRLDIIEDVPRSR
ncbi:hypothetical protein IWQ47_002200 [Aquimarina sp. EL_43]|uniref:DUF6794 domain-containing protein n=1 Tax=unclassified Aquimarina TaxID=2627091 RepID=UPI0018C8F8BB|nr:MULTISPECIES: DUF6794 domain-containing protein [unclassified Aquimarina]MBG6130736.1 hypothetical protein [Aquimarina sp. EL_35]MBG6151117.1 hypothetical protein [Aquimarina sp. EL_32]MBG6169126.1 hypothetical protein [Aquimarina sp. EL_43]